MLYVHVRAQPIMIIEEYENLLCISNVRNSSVQRYLVTDHHIESIFFVTLLIFVFISVVQYNCFAVFSRSSSLWSPARGLIFAWYVSQNGHGYFMLQQIRFGSVIFSSSGFDTFLILKRDRENRESKEREEISQPV